MRISRRSAVAVSTAAAFAACAGAAAPTGLADRGFFRSVISPSMPSYPKLHGSRPGSMPWQIDRGKSIIRLIRTGEATGELEVRVAGLIIPEVGTRGQVTSVDASLYCAHDQRPVETTELVPLSKRGMATIEEPVELPVLCLDPAVLIHPLGNTTIYIASSGWVF
ncbi:MAG TPA: hypothetical protein VMF09_08565 [Solirubrobacteraceae bacterium]|nr:hypothetical protein [Solirubrobacteraceae bacterium]